MCKQLRKLLRRLNQQAQCLVQKEQAAEWFAKELTQLLRTTTLAAIYQRYLNNMQKLKKAQNGHTTGNRIFLSYLPIHI